MLSASSYDHVTAAKVFCPSVIYFALGMTEGRLAGAFWVDKIVFEPEKRPAGTFWADQIVF